MTNSLLISNITIVNPDQDSFVGDIYIENGQILKVGTSLTDIAEQHIDGAGKDWLMFPGYIDMHIHGSAGYDTMDATEDTLRGMARSLVKEGVTGFLATTMTQAIPAIDEALLNVAQFDSCDGEAELLGVHIEGPFVSTKRAGAQPVEYITLPSLEQFNHWQELSGQRIKQITMAPEVEGGYDFVRALSEQGVIVSIGHSDATSEEVGEAVQLGLKQATHLYNQMRPFHHREVGVVGSTLLEDKLKVEIIVDFVHSHPQAVQIAYRLKGASGIILISDAMRAKGLPFGDYELGGQAVKVTEDGAQLSNGALAGSVLSMEQAVKNMQAVTNCSWQELVAMSSTNAASQMNLLTKGYIRSGVDADIVLLNQNLDVQITICRGKVVYEKS
ncbi:MAG: N-acetylglucosamine-6-phosphate deacetylase [Lysinibacillus sp.]